MNGARGGAERLIHTPTPTKKNTHIHKYIHLHASTSIHTPTHIHSLTHTLIRTQYCLPVAIAALWNSEESHHTAPHQMRAKEKEEKCKASRGEKRMRRYWRGIKDVK